MHTAPDVAKAIVLKRNKYTTLKQHGILWKMVDFWHLKMMCSINVMKKYYEEIQLADLFIV